MIDERWTDGKANYESSLYKNPSLWYIGLWLCDFPALALSWAPRTAWPGNGCLWDYRYWYRGPRAGTERNREYVENLHHVKKVMIKQLSSHLRCRLLAISTRMCIYSHSLEANPHRKAQWLIVWPVCQSLETCFLISGRQFGTNAKLNSRQFYNQDLSSGVPANVHQCYGEFWYKLRRARRSIEGAGPVRMSDAILVSLLWVLAMANNKLSIEGILTLEQPFVRVRLFRVH